MGVSSFIGSYYIDNPKMYGQTVYFKIIEEI
jgi:hypothetical protein